MSFIQNREVGREEQIEQMMDFPVIEKLLSDLQSTASLDERRTT